MAVIGKKLRSLEGGQVAFHCPGCNTRHVVRVEGAGRPKWGYNGNPDAPTFEPSVLVRNGHYSEHHKAGDGCWCTYADSHPDDPTHFKCFRCHSFVRDGKIQFLGDCSHDLAGQTVDLPDIEGAV